jgi:probable DNA metabolism protein
MHSVPTPSGFTHWRSISRGLLENGAHPSEVIWQRELEESLLFSSPRPRPKTSGALKVPVAFMSLAETASCHRSGDQWPLLYSVLWRLVHGERHLLSIASDPDIHRIQTMVKHINRDCHKMHAFVRFRKVGESPESGREQFVAWFEPEHKIVRLNASFFRKRFTNMDWSILTPDECMHWDGEKIHYTPSVDQSLAPDSDALEELWKSYYKSIFNVARVKIKAMQSEMPKKYWKNLPEAEVIESLLASSSQKVNDMLVKAPSAERPAPQNDYLQYLKNLPEE